MERLGYGLTVLFAFVVASCSTTAVPIKYNPALAVRATSEGASIIEVATVDDRRKVDARWLGAIRGGFGNPLKKLEADRPVSSMVKTAFEEGLGARHLLAEPGKAKFAFEMVIRKLDCSQLVRREAHINMDVRLVSLADGLTVFNDQVVVDRVSGSTVSFDVGIFASVEDLRQVMNDALQEAVDKVLDSPSLRGSLDAKHPT